MPLIFFLHSSTYQIIISLQAFWPGVQTLLGELAPAAKTLNSYFLAREELGFLPERFHFQNWNVDPTGTSGAGRHPLRPELLESAYLIYRSLHASSPSSGWEWAADFALHALQHLTWTPCGYASIRRVQRGGSRKHEIDLDDEMPSFFLSETIKYLYLIYDEDNLLHEDDGIEWIFTTEAHPMHFVPKEVTQHTDTKKNVTDSTPYIPSLEKQGPQAWTQKTPKSDFVSNINTVIEEFNRLTEHVTSDSKVANLFYGPTSMNLTKDQSIHSMKLSQLHFYPLGRKVLLPKNCANYYHSSLDWMHALNEEGGLEYQMKYNSMLSNDYEAQGLLHPYRPGLKVVREDDILNLGTIDKQDKPQANSNTQDTVTVAKEPNRSEDLPQQVGNRFDMGELGQFDVTVVGESIFVRHVQTNEVIESTILRGNTETEEDLILVTSSGKSGERRVVIADFHNRAYMCNVVIKRVNMMFGGEEGDENSFTDEFEVEKYPCAPGMYGPTSLNKLAETGGFAVKGQASPPEKKNTEGCLETLSDSKKHNPVQLVMRGKCSFQEKSLRQKVDNNADAVIVINTHQHSLFVMSRADDQIVDPVLKEIIQTENEPMSVLISLEHGIQILKLLDTYEASSEEEKNTYRYEFEVEMNKFSAMTFNEDGENVMTSWPHISTNQNSIQIFAYSNWGIHAVMEDTSSSDTNSQSKSGKAKSGEWQLYIMQHKGVKDKS